MLSLSVALLRTSSPKSAISKGLHDSLCTSDAVNYALDIDVIDPDSIRVIVEYRSQEPVELFSLDGRPQLAAVRVETTDVSAYQALLTEDR